MKARPSPLFLDNRGGVEVVSVSIIIESTTEGADMMLDLGEPKQSKSSSSPLPPQPAGECTRPFLQLVGRWRMFPPALVLLLSRGSAVISPEVLLAWPGSGWMVDGSCACLQTPVCARIGCDAVVGTAMEMHRFSHV